MNGVPGGGGRGLLLLLTLLLVYLAATSALASHAQAPARAGLVVVHGDGRVMSRCVDLVEPELSGYDLLLRSGLDLNAENSSMGMTVCRIDGTGCTTPQESCFCGVENGQPVYWSYWSRRNGDWNYSQLGASNSRVRPGDVDAWVWGTGAADAVTPLLAYSFDLVCTTATPTTTPEPTGADTPVPILTATPTPTVPPTDVPPTSTFTPTYTPWPTATDPPTSTFTPWPTETMQPTPTQPAPATVTPTPTATQTPDSSPTPSVTPTFPPPLIERLVADPTVINAGDSVYLAWETRRSITVTLTIHDATGEIQVVQVGASGELSITPTQSTRFRLTVWQGNQSAETEVEVVVHPALLPSPTPVSATTSEPLPAEESSTTSTPIPVETPPPDMPPSPPARDYPLTPSPETQPSVEHWLILTTLVALLIMGLALSGIAVIVLLTWLISDYR